MRGIKEAEELHICPLRNSSERMSPDISYVRIHITEILMPNDSREKSKIFDKEKLLEINGLNEWKV